MKNLAFNIGFFFYKNLNINIDKKIKNSFNLGFFAIFCFIFFIHVLAFNLFFNFDNYQQNYLIYELHKFHYIILNFLIFGLYVLLLCFSKSDSIYYAFSKTNLHKHYEYIEYKINFQFYIFNLLTIKNDKNDYLKYIVDSYLINEQEFNKYKNIFKAQPKNPGSTSKIIREIFNNSNNNETKPQCLRISKINLKNFNCIYKTFYQQGFPFFEMKEFLLYSRDYFELNREIKTLKELLLNENKQKKDHVEQNPKSKIINT